MTAASIYTIAGNGTAGSTGNAGPATSAELSSPQGVAVSATGNIAIADTANNVVRFVPATSGTYFGQSMTADDIYTVAGNGTSGYSGNGGAATSAELSAPRGVSFDAAGDLVIADASNHVVRFVPVASGTDYGQSVTANDIYTIAGNHTSGYSGNGGAATSAELSSPNDVTLDAAGDLLIPDTQNNVVRFVPVTSGTYFGQSMTANDIYTIAGNHTSGYSGNGGAATSAEFSTVMDASFDSAGDVFIADSGNDYLRFMPRTSGEFYGELMIANDVYNIAGAGTSNGDFGGDHDPPLQAEFGTLASVAYDGFAGFYLADSLDQRVRHDSFNLAYYTATPSYTYDADGEMTSATTPNGNVPVANKGNHTTVYTYDVDGEVKVAEQGGGAGATVTPRYTYYGYDGDGNETSMKDPNGYTFTYAFNADDEETLSTNPLGNATLTCYDGDGNVTETVPPVGVAASSLAPASCPTTYPTGYSDRLATDATTATYNALNEPTVVTTPMPPGLSGYETTTNAYDLGGRLTSVTAPPTTTTGGAPNDVTDYSYDAANELLTTVTGAGTATAATTSSCYDPDGEVTATIPGDGNVSGVASCSGTSPYETLSVYQTGYSYDSLGELVTQSAPATTAAPSGEVTTYAYDPAGNQTTLVSPDGVTATKTYTPLNLPASVSYSGSTPGITYTYDADGNEIAMTDASGTTMIAFDPFDEQGSTTNGAGATTTYAYDLDGNVDRITYPLGSGATWASTDTVINQFNGANQLYRVTDFNSKLTRIGYSADGLLTSIQFGSSSGPTVSTVYAANDEPTAITLSNGTTLQEFAYSDEPSGAVASETDTPSGSLSPADYVYDAQSRVTKDTPGSGSAKSYAADQSGNLTTISTGASGTYNDASELTSSVLSGTTTNYDYDASGNRTGESGGSTVSAAYNGASELTSYDNAAANMSSATYDGNGLRSSATTTPTGGSASTQHFVWNTVASVPELLMDSTNAYIYGPTGTPFEQVNLSTGTIQFLVADALGSVRGVVSSSGALTAYTSYDAWGNPETTGGLSSYTPFGFAGAYTDATGLLYLINRYYDPGTGMFFSVDPDVIETGQAYSYAGDDPVNGIDPSGLRSTSACGTQGSCPTEVSSGSICSPLVTASPSSSSPYSGWPAIAGPGPSYDIPIGPVTYVVTTSITVIGPNSTPNVAIDPDGNLTLSGAAGSSATFSWWNSSLELGGVGLTSSQTFSFGEGDKATVTFTLTPKTYPGNWADNALVVFDVALLAAPAALTLGATGSVIVVGGALGARG
jgi:RHS repeat-associated protein